METDAKGQLGGLDTSEAERKRCAEGSGAWKCASCGRSNVEILRECEEAAKLIEGGSRVEEAVPEGLVIGSKEDLERERKKDEKGDNEGETEAELAEGFVQTAPQPQVETPYPPARPAQTVPQPTGSSYSQAGQAALANQRPLDEATRRTQLQQRVSTEGVPIWIDRAIVGIVICLVVMILKMLLGY